MVQLPTLSENETAGSASAVSFKLGLVPTVPNQPKIDINRSELIDFIGDLLHELMQMASAQVGDEKLVQHLSAASQRAAALSVGNRSKNSGYSGDEWVAKLQPSFETLDPDAVVAINLATGDFVVGKTSIEAIDFFEAKFGKHQKGVLHKVGGPTFVGGGLWRSK